MKAYVNGHTIHRQMYHGDRWYTVDNLGARFVTTAQAANWIRRHFGQVEAAAAS